MSSEDTHKDRERSAFDDSNEVESWNQSGEVVQVTKFAPVDKLGRYLKSQNQGYTPQDIWRDLNDLGRDQWELTDIKDWDNGKGKGLGCFTRPKQGAIKWEYKTASTDWSEQNGWELIDSFEAGKVAFFKKRS